MTDLADLMTSPESPAWITLEHPTTFKPLADPNGNLMQVAIWGPDSTAVRESERRISAEIMERAARSRGGKFRSSPQMIESNDRQRFMSRVANWKNLVLNSEPFVYSEANKAMIYDDPKFGFIRRQIELAFGDDGAFLPSTDT